MHTFQWRGVMWHDWAPKWWWEEGVHWFYTKIWQLSLQWPLWKWVGLQKQRYLQIHKATGEKLKIVYNSFVNSPSSSTFRQRYITHYYYHIHIKITTSLKLQALGAFRNFKYAPKTRKVFINSFSEKPNTHHQQRWISGQAKWMPLN